MPATVLSVPDLLAAVQRYAQPKTISTLTVKLGDKIVLIRLDEITFFEADDKYVYLHTQEGKKYLLDDSLTTLEAKLP
ncbi:MAG: LytTR family transcriptional regulator, partial [Microscillaceae bacterium]|nr:LytTR family transcriptional regulator [Microscillaceae bacterium]